MYMQDRVRLGPSSCAAAPPNTVAGGNTGKRHREVAGALQQIPRVERAAGSPKAPKLHHGARTSPRAAGECRLRTQERGGHSRACRDPCVQCVSRFMPTYRLKWIR